MIASAERLLDAEKLIDDTTEALELDKVKDFYEELDTIGLNDVSFSYPSISEADENDKNVLEHFTLSIKRGEYVAFTGQSGCGKSTALKLFMCVYRPDSGTQVYKSKTNEEGELTSAYRRLFGYVPQGNDLMNGTVREVVTFADSKDSGNEERLWKALRIACADK